jgi:hypothetical protein
MTTTTANNATAIIIVRNKSIRNEFSNHAHPAHIAVFFVDADDDEVDYKEFNPSDSAKARAFAIKASEKLGIKLCGLTDFDNGTWY